MKLVFWWYHLKIKQLSEKIAAFLFCFPSKLSNNVKQFIKGGVDKTVLLETLVSG